MEVADILEPLEVGPGTIFSWKTTVDPSLKVTVAEIGPGDSVEGTETCSKFPSRLIQGTSGLDVMPVGTAPSCMA